MLVSFPVRTDSSDDIWTILHTQLQGAAASWRADGFTQDEELRLEMELDIIKEWIARRLVSSPPVDLPGKDGSDSDAEEDEATVRAKAAAAKVQRKRDEKVLKRLWGTLRAVMDMPAVHIPELVAESLFRAVMQLLKAADRLQNDTNKTVEGSQKVLQSESFLECIFGAKSSFPPAAVYGFMRELVEWNGFLEVAEQAIPAAIQHVEYICGLQDNDAATTAVKFLVDTADACPASMLLPKTGRLPTGPLTAKWVLGQLAASSVPARTKWLLLRAVELIEISEKKAGLKVRCPE